MSYTIKRWTIFHKIAMLNIMKKNHEKSNKKFIKGKGTNEDGKRKG